MILALFLAAVAVQQAAREPFRLEVLSTAPIEARRIDEASGVAASAVVPGVVWMHNDSGDGPFLYATDLRGRDLGRVRVDAARNVDWEDLAPGPCLVAPGRCLYVGDTGDNRRRRKHVVVYRLREPAPPGGASDTLRHVAVLDSLVLRYPDGAHDAESIVVTRGGALLLITKDRAGPATLYRADAGPGAAARDLVRAGPLAMRISALTGRLATGAALAPGDSLLVVRTYVSLHFFRLTSGSVPTPLGTALGVLIPVVEPQGEGVAFDGPDRLVLVSERGGGSRGVISHLRMTASH